MNGLTIELADMRDGKTVDDWTTHGTHLVLDGVGWQVASTAALPPLGLGLGIDRFAQATVGLLGAASTVGRGHVAPRKQQLQLAPSR